MSCTMVKISVWKIVTDSYDSVILFMEFVTIRYETVILFTDFKKHGVSSDK